MQQQWNYRVELTSYNSDISFNIQYCEYATHLCPDPETIPDPDQNKIILQIQLNTKMYNEMC